jgi:hypothetical protein
MRAHLLPQCSKLLRRGLLAFGELNLPALAAANAMLIT